MRDQEGRATRDEGSISYTAAIESAETKETGKVLAPFTQRVEREAKRRARAWMPEVGQRKEQLPSFDAARRQVAIGDGAPWLWNIVAECFPGAIEILDKFHAKEHVHDVAKDVFGAGSDMARAWSKLRCDEIDEGKLDALIGAVAEHASRSETARKCAGYFTNNRHRMDYPTFESMGLCVGSGVVEAGCNTAVGVRMKRAGMRWTVRGANAIAALRCCRLSGRYENFWAWRARIDRDKAA